ncbi:Roundabout 2 [Amphibalanus amphitrite]|uniref:Roundabout 2 n=1 Tax=Amphibalanus amphitrite TaxID=1232801 RepID=A0A6A4WJY6_AMPAM|nr:Roundabout 2 [Amphibalanus amphitrite]
MVSAARPRVSTTGTTTSTTTSTSGSTSSDTVAATTTALRGETVQLRCPLTDLTRSAAVQWRRANGRPLPVGASSGPQLLLRTVSVANSGLYQCRVGAEMATVRLSVHAEPELRAAPADTAARAGSEVTLPCAASSHPQPLVFWAATDTGMVLFPGTSQGSASVYSNGTLHVKVRERSGNEGNNGK